MIAAARADLREDIVAQLRADSDEAVRQARADAQRRSPFWPFAQLTAQQLRERAAQERAMRAAARRAEPDGLL